jgi:hypothetical protein
VLHTPGFPDSVITIYDTIWGEIIETTREVEAERLSPNSARPTVICSVRAGQIFRGGGSWDVGGAFGL